MALQRDASFERDVVVIGGCGHVGLPLAIAFADRGAEVAVYDVNPAAVRQVSDGRMPFDGAGCRAAAGARGGAGRRLVASADPAIVGSAEHVVVVIGTPVDEHLNPDQQAITRALAGCAEHLRDGQLLVLRSTVYPGRHRAGGEDDRPARDAIDVAFCPERIAEGKAMTELFELPQIISARRDAAFGRAGALFGLLGAGQVRMAPEEAELAKLFTNAWRYIKFATANQLYMIANDRGLDFEKIRRGLVLDYPRAADLPAAGFAAGPCLLKDTMQLAAFNNNNFALGHTAMAINEGLPLYLVDRLQRRYDLEAWRSASWAWRSRAARTISAPASPTSSSGILTFVTPTVYCTDPYVSVDASLLPLDDVVAKSDLLIIAAPHAEYAGLATDKPVVDIWNIRGEGVRI